MFEWNSLIHVWVELYNFVFIPVIDKLSYMLSTIITFYLEFIISYGISGNIRWHKLLMNKQVSSKASILLILYMEHGDTVIQSFNNIVVTTPL